MVSKSCKYALRATVYIASRANEGVKLGIKEIAREINAPEAFTAKLLQALSKHRIVSSLKGPCGGFYSEPAQQNLPVISIVNAIDGLAVFRECGMGLHECSDLHPCPMHVEYAKTRDQLHSSFQHTTIASLAATLREGTSYINNA